MFLGKDGRKVFKARTIYGADVSKIIKLFDHAIVGYLYQGINKIKY